VTECDVEMRKCLFWTTSANVRVMLGHCCAQVILLHRRFVHRQTLLVPDT
jgi:hypothetical protein